MAAPLAGRAEHLAGTLALLTGNFPGTPAFLAAHHEMSFARSLTARTFDQPRRLAAGAVDAPMTFAACADTIAQGAVALADITNDLGFHFQGLLVLPESIIMRKFQSRRDGLRCLEPSPRVL